MSHKERLYIEEGKHLLVPLVEHPICCSSQSVRESKNGASGSNLSAEKWTKHSKGTRGILVVKKLMNDQENWRSVTSKYDYQFPGIFEWRSKPADDIHTRLFETASVHPQ